MSQTGRKRPRSASPKAAERETAETTASVLLKDPIYRIMHRLPRSDILEIVKCKFGRRECERALRYFDESFTANPLRRFRLQIGCDGPTGITAFLDRIALHRTSLRLLDLSRNDLSSDDVVQLCGKLGLSGAPGASAAGPSEVSASPLEVLDISYNRRVGNEGALHLMRALQQLSTIRAVIMKGVGIDDDGAVRLVEFLRHRPECRTGEAAAAAGFFVNLNENHIGSVGTFHLGKGLPAFVSLSLCKQRVAP